MIQYTQADIARFFKYVEKLPNGCWFWAGARSRGKGNKKWYGSFRLNGTTYRLWGIDAAEARQAFAGHAQFSVPYVTPHELPDSMPAAKCGCC